MGQEAMGGAETNISAVRENTRPRATLPRRLTVRSRVLRQCSQAPDRYELARWRSRSSMIFEMPPAAAPTEMFKAAAISVAERPSAIIRRIICS